MKIKSLSFAITFSALIYGLSAQAHEPKEHMQDAKKPDCAAMDNMDQSKMDMDDPVMQAMMKQCMNGMSHKQKSGNDSQKQNKQEVDVPPVSDDEATEHSH